MSSFGLPIRHGHGWSPYPNPAIDTHSTIFGPITFFYQTHNRRRIIHSLKASSRPLSPTVDLNVKLYEPTLVPPADHNGNDNGDGEEYFLSNLDQVVAGALELFFCFKATPEMRTQTPPEAIREALKKVLVFYYPLAGRLKTNPQGKLYVQCTGEGALFVESQADCRFDDIASQIAKFDLNTLKKLVYSAPGADANMLMRPLTVQVTTFQCGGFVVGICTNHAMCDGLAIQQFLISWCEIARGVASLSVPPFLDRTLLRARSPPTVEFPHLEYSKMADVIAPKESTSQESLQYEQRCFSFSPESVDKLKKLAMEEGTLFQCTPFQVISAHVWRCHTKALGVGGDQQIKLLFVMDVRRRLKPRLPKGYFGDAIFHPCAVCSAAELLENGLSFGVGQIQRSMKMVTDRYLRSAIDYLESKRAELPPNNVLEITTWSGIPFNELDFGWGKPVHYGPASLPPHNDFVSIIPRASEEHIDVLVSLPPPSMVI